MLLVVGGIKGGTGKTTLATNLAVCRAAQGKRVLLIDGDEQRSSMDWSAQRGHKSGACVATMALVGKQAYQSLEKLMAKEVSGELWDDIIVDAGGRDTSTQRSALLMSDAFLTPFKPRSMDIWTLTALRKLNSEIGSINKKLRVMAVLNQSDPRGTDSKVVREIFRDEGLECLKVEIGNRKAFPNAASDGLGVIEFKESDSKSFKEIMLLHDDLYKGNMLDMFNNNGKDLWLSHAK